MMKYTRKLLFVAAATLVSFAACKKQTYIDYNTNPATIYNVSPEQQFTNGCIAMFDADFEYYYDYYRIMMPWMQYFTPVNGNSKTYMQDVGNFNQRRGYFYGRVGNVLTDVLEIIKLQPEAEQANRQHQVAITKVLLTYYAFYATDINGSLPYSEAFRARYGGTITPKYDTQEELYNTFDTDLKAAIATLKSNAASQVNFGNADLYYKGDAAKWAKAANALRLRIAMRWGKRNPNKLQEIANEVIAGDLLASNADNLEFISSSSHAGAGGNWDPSGALFKGSKALVDFMNETNDPRIRIFFQQNAFSQQNVDLAKAQGVLPGTAVASAQRYIGGFASPDQAADPANAKFYNNNRNFLNANGTQQPLDTLSRIQYRLFCPGIENPVLSAPRSPGTGNITFPMLTYAEQLFYRAELAAKGITTENAEQLYESGVKASMRYYDVLGSRAQVFDYTAITDAEINTAYNHADVKFDAAKALDQIASQSYIHFFKQANEGWALYKRTGMPNTTTVLAFEEILSDGVVQKMPRRSLINLPLTTDRNFDNAKAAIDQMALDPEFGAGPGDIYGRVWWDKQ